MEIKQDGVEIKKKKQLTFKFILTEEARGTVFSFQGSRFNEVGKIYELPLEQIEGFQKFMYPWNYKIIID
jgi:hypothetical protein